MKLFLRLVNLLPLFAALLILDTAFKLAWQHIAARARKGSFAAAFAGAMAVQRP